MTKEAKKLKARKVENPMKWMADDAFHAAVKDELQKFISSNDYIKVPKEYMSAVLLIAWHFAEWGKPQPSLHSNLDEAATKYAKGEYDKKNPATLPDRCKGCYAPLMYAFKDGAEWQIEQFEKNRLAACDAQTKEEYDMETAFVDKIIKEQHRTPTFSDAIKHGIEWMAGQGETIECSVDWYDGPILDFSAEQLDSAIMKAELEVGDKVVVQIRKK